ncbi:unnamed protein product [Lactuca virosa]|uniref:phosphoethanolamine N-methyltransferase n=1 Tax=Lactuca virosa TaxID=75947 RepID=A0AAU9PWZ8_9ASTR|nr:unnamed protein product [Lactuca virosa]
MISFALERSIGLKCSVEFEVADCTKKSYPDNSFDVIYSRDTILHIQDKSALFGTFYKWLKPGGKLLISGYCRKSGKPSQDFAEYIKQRGYDLHDVETYGQVQNSLGKSLKGNRKDYLGRKSTTSKTNFTSCNFPLEHIQFFFVSTLPVSEDCSTENFSRRSDHFLPPAAGEFDGGEQTLCSIHEDALTSFRNSGTQGALRGIGLSVGYPTGNDGAVFGVMVISASPVAPQVGLPLPLLI